MLQNGALGTGGKDYEEFFGTAVFRNRGGNGIRSGVASEIPRFGVPLRS